MIRAYAPAFGDAITETAVVPERTIRPGTETLDGVTLAYEKADRAEAGVNLVIELREKEYDFVLSGHGLPATMQALADMAGYLEDAKTALYGM